MPPILHAPAGAPRRLLAGTRPRHAHAMMRGKMQPTAPSSTVAHTKSLLGLEVMRFLCALSVLVWHYQHFYYVGTKPVGLVTQAQPWFGLLQPFYLYGYLGVQAFWCLSGFIFFWKYAQPVAQGQVAVGRFAWLRFSRLYPLHLLTLLAVALLAAAYRWRHGSDFVYPHNDLKHFALQLFLASDWGLQDGWSFNGPIWSISVEVLVYALFYGLCRLGLTRWWHVAGLIGLSGTLYGSRLTAHPVVLCIFFFYLGALTHLGWRALGASRPTRQRLVLALFALAIVAATAWLALGHLRPMFYVALVTPLSAVLLLSSVQPRSARVAGWISTLGDTTYASYLLHFPLQLLVATALPPGTPPARVLPLQHPAWLLGFVALSFGLAVLVYRHVEVPAQAWLRRRMERARPRPRRTAPLAVDR